MDARTSDRDNADPYEGRAMPPEGPVEAGAEPSPLGLKPAQTSIPSPSSSSSSSSLLREDSSGSPSLAYALRCFSSAWQTIDFLRARLFASSIFRFCSLAASRRTCLAAASSRTGGQAVRKPQSPYQETGR